MTETWWVIVGTALTWIAYDVYAYMKWGNPGTLSVAINKLGSWSMGFVLLVGFLLGHLFWQVHICQ